MLAQRIERLPRVAGPHVGDVQHHAEPLQVRVEAVLGQLDHLERLLDALHREVLRLGRQQRVVGGDEGVDGQQPERGRAVDQHDVVVAGHGPQRLLERQLAPELAAEHQLGLGEPEVRRHDPAVDRLGCLRMAGEHIADGGRRVRIDVEVVREVALGIEVDGEHPQPDPAEDVGQGPDRRGLAGAALLGEDRDRGHRGGTIDRDSAGDRPRASLAFAEPHPGDRPAPR